MHAITFVAKNVVDLPSVVVKNTKQVEFVHVRTSTYFPHSAVQLHTSLTLLCVNQLVLGPHTWRLLLFLLFRDYCFSGRQGRRLKAGKLVDGLENLVELHRFLELLGLNLVELVQSKLELHPRRNKEEQGRTEVL